MTKGLVQVRFVGSGDAFGSGGRFQACILLHAPSQDGDVLLDCGASSLIALKQQHQDPNQGVRDGLAAEPRDVQPQQQRLSRGFR